MANHVHLILLPRTAAGLMVGLRETHRRYTRYVNRRERWHGYLWQGRFAPCILDEAHLLAAARYESSKRGQDSFYLLVGGMVAEIGRLLGGWLRAEQP